MCALDYIASLLIGNKKQHRLMFDVSMSNRLNKTSTSNLFWNKVILKGEKKMDLKRVLREEMKQVLSRLSNEEKASQSTIIQKKVSEQSISTLFTNQG